MLGRQLTIEQKEEIQGVFFDENTFFSCALDINNNWFVFLSTENIEALNGSQWQWVVDLPESNYVEPIPEE